MINIMTQNNKIKIIKSSLWGICITGSLFGAAFGLKYLAKYHLEIFQYVMWGLFGIIIAGALSTLIYALYQTD